VIPNARLTRVAFMAAVCLAVAGCRQWTIVRGPAPVATSSLAVGDRVRVELLSGGVVTLDDASVRGGMLAGRTGLFARYVEVPIADIRNLEREERRPGRTRALIFSTLAVAATVATGILMDLAACRC
jgi:hypothetical protein